MHASRKGGRLEDGHAHTADHEQWTRRAFLRTLGFGTAASTFMLGGTPMSAIGSSAMLAPLLGVESDRVLILVQLDGGNDGLNTVVPITNDVYYRSRPNLALQPNQTIRLNDSLGLNTELRPWQSYFNAGQLGIVQGVGYNNPNLSHFRSTDIWMAGYESDVNERSGWTGRFLEQITPDFLSNPPVDPLAVQMGGTSFLFKGRNNDLGMSISSTELFERFASGSGAYSLDGVPTTRAGQEMQFIRQIVNNSFRYASSIQNASESTTNSVSYPESDFAENLANVARLIKGGLNTKVYMVSLGGFDTHSDQAGLHEYLLMDLATAVDAFMQDLAASGMQDRALVMTFSEFGRTIWENGSAGTDHSTAAPMFLMGSGANGGIYGAMQDLQNTDANGDPYFTVDFRSVYASVLQGWFCLEPSDIQAVFGTSLDTLPLIQGSASVSTQDPSSVATFSLDGNYPNPFRGSTRIKFTLGRSSHVHLEVFDVQGRRLQTVLDQTMPSGSHETVFDASRLPGGTYYYRLRTDDVVKSSSMVVF